MADAFMSKSYLLTCIHVLGNVLHRLHATHQSVYDLVASRQPCPSTPKPYNRMTMPSSRIRKVFGERDRAGTASSRIADAMSFIFIIIIIISFSKLFRMN